MHCLPAVSPVHYPGQTDKATLIKRKYRYLYSPRGGTKPGPKRPSKDVIQAIVEMKRRILANHYKPDSSDRGPSWLTTLGRAKDSRWSVDLFRCESILLKTHWVLVVMDKYTLKIIGFSVHAGHVDEPTLCCMTIISTGATQAEMALRRSA